MSESHNNETAESISKRDIFAALMLQGRLSNRGLVKSGNSKTAAPLEKFIQTQCQLAVRYAVALLAELEKKQQD